MPTLYIANTTKQDHDFLFRIPGDPRIHRVQIPLGTQRTVWSNPTAEMCASVVAQHEKYGLVDARLLDQTRGFVGICFSVDKPVPLDVMLKVIEQNAAALSSIGQTIRTETTAATFASWQANEAGREGAKVQRLQVEVIEDQRKLTDPVGFHEHYEARQDGDAPKRSWFGIGRK